MSHSCTCVDHKGNNASTETEVIVSTNNSTGDTGSSYNLTRYLSDTSNHPPGHRPAQAVTGSGTTVLGEIRKFEEKFSLNGDAPSRS
ncbi:hypothetical protein V8C40DRAFT_271733 [Trichoderma camerunense]